jgi:hypothetical protein
MRAVRDGSNDTLAVFRFADAGQVVPSEKIAAAPGLVALQSDEHDRARAWIVVFDHPYFAVTEANGSFRLDSVPPGKYHVRVWHERGRAVVERDVEVRTGGEATVEMKLRLR